MRFAQHSGAWEVRGLATLQEWVRWQPGENLVFGCPWLLSSRNACASHDRTANEFVEMGHAVKSKGMPYATEEMTTGSEIISQTGRAASFRPWPSITEQLSEMARRLSLGLIPSR